MNNDYYISFLMNAKLELLCGYDCWQFKKKQFYKYRFLRAVERSSKYSYLGIHETTIHTYSAFETQFNFQFYQMSCLLTGDISRHALTGFVSLWRQTTIQPLFSVRFWTSWKNVITPKKYISLGKTVQTMICELGQIANLVNVPSLPEMFKDQIFSSFCCAF